MTPERVSRLDVPSLARALWEREVDILIGSIPFGGARTKIEACCAATPMLSFLSPGTPRFGVTHLQPSALPLWQTADELVSLLKAVDIAWLQHHSQLVRRYFVNNHHSDAHCRALVSLDESSPASLCARQASTVDELCDREAVSASMQGEWAWLAGELPGISSSG